MNAAAIRSAGEADGRRSRSSLDGVDKIYAPPRQDAGACGEGARPRRRARARSSRCSAPRAAARPRRLRMIAGFEAVTHGRDHAGRPAHRDAAAGAPQRRHGVRGLFALSAADRARQHRLRAEERAHVARARRERRVAEIAALVEIEPILDRYPSSISGGQQQRASLARALVRQADLYLLDEPMGQLEPRLRAAAARPAEEAAERARHDLDLRHPRPDRGQRARRPRRGDGGRRAAAVRQPDGTQGAARQSVRRHLHRRAADERVRRRGRDRRARALRRRRTGRSSISAANEFSEAARDAIARRERVVIGVRPHDVRLGAGP